MLEYIGALKTLVDILKGVLDLKNAVKTDALIFNEVVRPVYSSMSKIVSDYIQIISELERAISVESERKSAVQKFRKDRLAQLPLRREVMARCDAVVEDKDLAPFHQFFSLSKEVFTQSDMVFEFDVNRLARRLDSITIVIVTFLEHDDYWEYEQDVKEYLNQILEHLESDWTKLSSEFARLDLLYAKRKLK